jgi:hypothetical protein
MRWVFFASTFLSFSLVSSRAIAGTPPLWTEEKSFDALRDGKHGDPCKVVFKTDVLELCDGQSVPRKASVDYRYRNRTQNNNCNALGFFCSFFDHRFIIGWKSEGDSERKSFTLVFRNTQTAEQFNQTMARWSDTTPEEMSR